MNNKEIAEKVRQEIKDLTVCAHNDFSDGIDLQTDLSFDRLDLCELAMNLEEKFDIVIPEDEASEQNTVGDWINTVTAKLKSKGLAEKDDETH